MSFETALEKVLSLEGGLVLHKNPTEEAQTYAGIYRKAHPEWQGWEYIDKGQTPPLNLIKNFYYENFYKPFEAIKNEKIKDLLFETAVNIGIKAAVKLLQKVVGARPDGILGQKTIQKLNEYLTEKFEKDFIKDFTLARIAFYTNIANQNPEKYSIYLRGWINRSLEVMSWVS